MTEDPLHRFAKVIIEGVLEKELTYSEGVELLREINDVLGDSRNNGGEILW